MTLVYIISAPSGSGKSTLVNELRKFVSNLDFSISYTTRAPRGSEQNGREYYFISRPEFDKMVRRDEFFEHAEVFGHCYGTAKRFLTEAESGNHDLVLDIDVQGAAQIKQKLPQAVSIFILPPDRGTLEWRLRSRGLDTDAVIDRRLATAKREIENYDKYDYILVNDRLDQSVDALKAIVLAERSRRSGATPSAQDSRNLHLAEGCRLEEMRQEVRRILRSFEEGSSGTASGF
ncbi:MAG: guanylate kinase [Acidobacteria bacterium]|nr:guanylate kinase [Acidobacteriota bacterium]